MPNYQIIFKKQLNCYFPADYTSIKHCYQYHVGQLHSIIAQSIVLGTQIAVFSRQHTYLVTYIAYSRPLMVACGPNLVLQIFLTWSLMMYRKHIGQWYSLATIQPLWLARRDNCKLPILQLPIWYLQTFVPSSEYSIK